MDSKEINDMLHQLRHRLAEIDNDYRFEMRAIGQRQYRTEMRVWMIDQRFLIWILPLNEGLTWQIEDLSYERPRLLAHSGDTTYHGRGWKMNFIADVVDNMVDVLNKDI